jgi:hypothetical protein
VAQIHFGLGIGKGIDGSNARSPGDTSEGLKIRATESSRLATRPPGEYDLAFGGHRQRDVTLSQRQDSLNTCNADGTHSGDIQTPRIDAVKVPNCDESNSSVFQCAWNSPPDRTGGRILEYDKGERQGYISSLLMKLKDWVQDKMVQIFMTRMRAKVSRMNR